ncbi:nitroreductase [Oceanispirochaeta crateris]|uniref:Nitroreductase n=1 Tax=Oceanispirochaeta crateris TaxID=2518645 RepID=A0A5C1QU60_9SPIO|nr:nitroreductase family protein [Oceanispirochaeta crateris]QEN09582.1 nitroreductase [Oceanispirochaeta crateris]
MTFLELAKKRYSARKFTNKPVEKIKLDQVLEAGRVAPTASNNQPQKLLVVQSEEGLQKMTKAARFYKAPVVIIVCIKKEEAWVREYDKKQTIDIDASIVTDHMMMAATDLGLDSLWMTWFHPAVLRSEFQIPSTLEPVNLLALGYNGAEPKSSDRHEITRKSLSEIVAYEQF